VIEGTNRGSVSHDRVDMVADGLLQPPSTPPVTHVQA